MTIKTLVKGMVAGAVITTTAGLLVRAANRESDQTRQTLPTVNSVDLSRYVGRWYEIARLPMRFEKDCVSDVTATYTLRADGKVNILNQCRKASGEMKKARGTARVVDKTTNAKLKVTFFWPFSGDYWVLDLGGDYEYAVVGDPSRKYLWILSRTPQIDEALYQSLLNKAAAQGFPVEKLVKTRHGS